MVWKTLTSIAASIKPLLKGKDDRFLVLEIFEHGLRGASIQANFLDKELKVVKVRNSPATLTTGQSDLKKLVKKFGRLGKYKIIVGLDSHLASTIYSSIILPREKYKELIDEPELDNLLSQAIWKFFDRSRNKVAGKMSVADLDILLTDVRIRGIKLDGHKVVNPLGFNAKTVEVQFSQTFLSRGLIDSLKEALPLNQVVLMSENGTAWSSVIAKATAGDGDAGQKNFLLANVFPSKTQLFFSNGSQNSYHDQFHWGENNLKQSLCADLAVDEQVSALIMDRYIRADASATFRHRLESMVLREMTTLSRALENASKRTDTRVIYVNPFFHLPDIFAASFKNQFSRSVQLRPLTLDLISQKFGFEIKFKHSADARNSFSLLAAVIEWYLAPQDDKMSQLAKRRVRWLSPV